MATDLYLSTDGELQIGADGDLKLVHGDEQVIQEVIFRLKTTKGDWVLSPNIGCSLEEFIGAPNTSLTHAAIEERIRQNLTQDLLLAMPEVHAVDMPTESGENTQVFILIEFASLEKDYRKIQVTADLDLRLGEVVARSSVRDIQ